MIRTSSAVVMFLLLWVGCMSPDRVPERLSSQDLEKAKAIVASEIGVTTQSIVFGGEDDEFVRIWFQPNESKKLNNRDFIFLEKALREVLSIPESGDIEFVSLAADSFEGYRHRHDEIFQRQIYFKLPLTQPRFHWRFTDRQQFLNGSLELIIKSEGGESRAINVFREGKLSEDWRVLGEPEEEDGTIYFGFQSLITYSVSMLDVVEVVLQCQGDLDGIGADSKGILKQGEYRSSSPFHLYFIKGQKNPNAYLSHWDPTWDLMITANQGWMDEE